LAVEGYLSAPFVTGPSIDEADGEKCPDCLTPPKGGGGSARTGRVGDAQDNPVARTRSFGSFSSRVQENEP